MCGSLIANYGIIFLFRSLLTLILFPMHDIIWLSSLPFSICVRSKNTNYRQLIYFFSWFWFGFYVWCGKVGELRFLLFHTSMFYFKILSLPFTFTQIVYIYTFKSELHTAVSWLGGAGSQRKSFLWTNNRKQKSQQKFICTWFLGSLSVNSYAQMDMTM